MNLKNLVCFDRFLLFVGQVYNSLQERLVWRELQQENVIAREFGAYV